MGYVPARTHYKLDFSQTEYAGLEVTTRSASMATLLAILTLHDEAEQADAKDALAKLDELFGLFEGVLVSWNVETEDGEAVPASKAGLLSQDSPFCLAVIQMWAQSMTSAPPPLPKPSGDTSLEESIPMTPGPGN